jgi:branched-chain amino acid transport system ATP-binding protein
MAHLEIVGVEAGYGRIRVIRGVSIQARAEKITLLIGPNGSGKSTLAKVIAGLVPLSKGSVFLNGKEITGLEPEEIVKGGIALVPEGRHLFCEMSVRENLLMGGVLLDSSRTQIGIDRVCQLFPVLKERSSQMAGTLSGGEQQMLAIARALISGSKVLILDEPCNGMSPKITEKILEVILHLKQKGTAVLLIEQNAEAIEIADYAYTMRRGMIVTQGKAQEVFSPENMKKLLLTEPG